MTARLDTERLIIRPLQLTDSSAVYDYRSNPEVVRYQMWRPESESDVRQFIREQLGLTPGMPGIWYQFGLVRKADNELIGDCGIHIPLEHTEAAELGMTLAQTSQRLGYATEAIVALLDYCFTSLGLLSVLARTEKRNMRSIALIRRMDFYPARAENFGLAEEEDELLFVMERPDWERRKAAQGRHPSPGGLFLNS
ncbi:MAG: GNAT family N-acetyltransferase [Ignavibacteria bacterium]|nr:MAG: GNAT family N-acetyltransferase [Ignavibacteria bacterium]